MTSTTRGILAICRFKSNPLTVIHFLPHTTQPRDLILFSNKYSRGSGFRKLIGNCPFFKTDRLSKSTNKAN